MPESLRLIAILAGCGAAAAPISFVVQERQETKRIETQAEVMTGGNVARGRHAIEARQCGACHEIPGMDDARGLTGPTLEGMAGRRTIAGLLRNDPAALIHWLRRPQSVVPGNAMPDMGIGEREARDIAAYLYTLSPKPG